MQKPKKLPRDANALAARIVALSIGQASGDTEEIKPVTARAKKGAMARAKALTKEQRTEIARVAAAARWRKA